jgi:hypothetical protein
VQQCLETGLTKSAWFSLDGMEGRADMESFEKDRSNTRHWNLLGCYAGRATYLAPASTDPSYRLEHVNAIQSYHLTRAR